MPSLLHYIAGTAECAGAISLFAHRRTAAQRTCSVLVAGQLLGSRCEVGEIGAGFLLLGQSLDGDVVVSRRLAQCADRRLFLADMGERVPVVPAARILEGHLVDVVVGHVVLPEHLVELLWCTRP